MTPHTPSQKVETSKSRKGPGIDSNMTPDPPVQGRKAQEMNKMWPLAPLVKGRKVEQVQGWVKYHPRPTGGKVEHLYDELGGWKSLGFGVGFRC